ncbi:serine/threonine-protein kinase [candidate division KSB1 bacterium]|nr:serine/threonine-protein kinase [candidate division KSB1 bacterium]
MDSNRWNKVQALFEAALERQPAEREAFLRDASAGESALYEEVKALLEADARPHSLLDGFAGDAINLPEALSLEGKLIGAYRVIRQIGAGGMGNVYLAERADGQFEQKVALKHIKLGLGSVEILKRFQSERQILARLQHQNIARLLDGGLTADGRPFFTMEFVEGKPIDQYCDHRRLSVDERLELFRTVCATVQYAHRNLVVHRDLKPSNILVTEDGAVKLLDFGIAKLLSAGDEAPSPTTLTQLGQRVMTPEYASPEQVRGEPIITASDVYSLGVILYELLSGHRPYQLANRSPAEVEKLINTTEPKKPSTVVSQRDDTAPVEAISLARSTQPEKLRRQLAGDLDNICLMALRKEPERRYHSVEQLLQDVTRHLQRLPVSARPSTLAYRAQKFVQRHKIGVAMTTAIVFLISGLIGFYTWRLANERDRAQLEAKKAAQVSAFLADLFKVSDPSEARGRTITARELLDRGAQRLANELADQPEVQAQMMEVTGTVYQSLAQLDSASALLEKSLAIRRKLPGNVQADIARTLWVLGKVKVEQGDYNAADSLQRLSLNMRRDLFGNQNEEVAESLSSLGKIMYQKGRYAEAETLDLEALAIRRALFGEFHPGVALNLDDLGWLMYERGRYDAADSLHRQALAIRQELFGAENLEVAESLNNLGGALYAKGDYENAEPLIREALAIRRKLLGDDHPQTTFNLTNLAVLLEAKHAYDEAENLYRDILAKHQRKLGEEHPVIADDLTDIGRVLTAKRNYEQAEPYFRQAVALHRKLRGPEHWLVAYTLNSLAGLLYEKGQAQAALPIYENALAIYRKAWKKPNQHVANALIGYGATLTEVNKPQTAESCLREGLGIFQNSLKPGHWQLARAQSLLGTCLAALQKFDEAEPLLLESYRALKEKRGAKDKLTQQTLARIVKLYESWDKPGKAGEYRAALAN